MPTSSIFHSVKITDPKAAESIVNALEEAEKNPPRHVESDIQPLTYSDEIRERFSSNAKEAFYSP